MRSVQTSRHSARADRRGIALIVVMLATSMLMTIGVLFSGSVTADYRSATYYRLATEAEQHCLSGMHRAMAELMYDVWGVDEDRPFVSARYNPDCADPPCDNLLSLGSTAPRKMDRAAYYESSSGTLEPIVRQNGFWNGEAWVVWAGWEHGRFFPTTGDAEVDGNVWNMDPRTAPRPEKIGGAQRYLSYGQGTVAVVSGEKNVVGLGTEFDKSWGAGTDIYINGIKCDVRTVRSPTLLTIWNPWEGATASGLGWCVAGSGSAAASADGSLQGGPVPLKSFVASGNGFAANPRWVNPEAFVSYSPMHGESFRLYGGADLNGDGIVNATDKALRNWALWKLKCDAFLPEATDNNGAFEAQLHANDRLRGNGEAFTLGSKDVGYEFISPLIVGDSFYQVFRFDPIYTMWNAVSGETEDQCALASHSDRSGYRYPYDRTHLGRRPSVDDPAGGLVNINQVNNDHDCEPWAGVPDPGATPDDLAWHRINEAKWIYCYDPADAGRRLGRYAVTVLPDCASWNAAALQSGTPEPTAPSGGTEASGMPTGAMEVAGKLLSAIRSGYHPNTGDPCDASLLAAMDDGAGKCDALCCYAPIRPAQLPPSWTAVEDDQPDGASTTYWCADGFPGAGQGTRTGPVDRTRAPEIWGNRGGRAWDEETGVRSAIHNYMIMLGQYGSRAEFATHLRKACISLPAQSPTGGARACMETGVNATDAALAEVARSARLIASQTTVHGYYYTLDRFWDRNLLLVDWAGADSDGATDSRMAAAQCSAARPTNPADAGAGASQRTRNALMRELHNLECFGGYRTRDGGYRLLDYLFHGDPAPADYVSFLDDRAGTAFHTPLSYAVGPAYGGCGPIQARAGRREKFMANAISRIASAQHADGETAACANGHVLHNPELSVFHKPVWDRASMTRAKAPRTSPEDECLDEIGAGCPVCGGRLFLANVYELNINEIGAFRGKLRNAERPTRAAWDLRATGGDRRPARHFVELLLSGRYREDGASNAVARFDMIMLSPGDGTVVCNTPAILADPVTGRPYFSSPLEYERRWRRSSNAADAAYDQGLDPEPLFRGLPNKPGDTGGPYSNYLNLHLLVYDDNDRGGRWHDATWFVDGPASALNHRTGKPDFYPGDPQLYDRAVVTDDTAPDQANWSRTPLRCDEYYSMPDPDPAHRQAEGGASISLYRKMPVRWHGGCRRDAWQLHYEVMSSSANAPLGVPGSGMPTETRLLRGIGFPETIRLDNKRDFYSHHDCLYAGDEAWRGVRTPYRSPAGFAYFANTEWPAFQYRDPDQYGVISFDAAFDGSRVALVYEQKSAEIPNYGSPCRIVSYVELADSAGVPLRIGDTCKSSLAGVAARDEAGSGTVLSWQARNPRDTRGNADGYVCWDLLPMTLNGELADSNDPTSDTTGYDPWWMRAYTPDCNWWCSGDDGFTDRDSAQVLPKGYWDLGSNLSCHNRNANMWNLDVPVSRAAFDGTTATSAASREAIHESLIRTLHDHCNAAGSRRAYRDKSNAMSTPTGIGRQADDDDGPPSTRVGFQRLIRLNFQGRACSWHEGTGTDDVRRHWAACSWNSWYKIFDVTDLCQALLWNSDPEETGGNAEGVDLVDTNLNGLRDEQAGASTPYLWSDRGRVALSPSVDGHFTGELRQVNKLNLNEICQPPTMAAIGWPESHASFGRKPLKGFHSPSGALARSYSWSGGDAAYNLHTTDPGYNLRIMPWDLDADASLESGSFDANGTYYGRLAAVHAGSSPVYTICVTGDSLDEAGEPLAEARLRATVERTWDGRCNILEFCWLPADRGLADR